MWFGEELYEMREALDNDNLSHGQIRSDAEEPPPSNPMSLGMIRYDNI